MIPKKQPAIVTYYGGCAGDLVTAIIDPNSTELVGRYIKMTKTREYFKIGSNQNRAKASQLHVLKRLTTQFKSIPSHWPHWHKENKHKIFFISVNTFEESEWARQRCMASFYGPELEYMRKLLTLHSYNNFLLERSKDVSTFANVVIPLDVIRSGDLIRFIQPYFEFSLDYNLYEQWLLRNA